MDGINQRYNKLCSAVGLYDDDLRGMLDKLGKLLDDVDGLEDWLFPVLDTVESRDLKKQDIPEIERVIQVRASFLKLLIRKYFLANFFA